MNNNDGTFSNSIDSQARELLSPYLDGEVTAAERDLVENAIAQSPQLRRELESLRQSVALFKAMPRAAAPRPFTLSELDAGLVAPKPARRNWLKWAMGGASAIAALAVVIMVGVTLFEPTQLGQSDTASVAMAPQMSEEAETPLAENRAATEMPMAFSAADEAAETPSAEMMKAAEAPAAPAPMAAEVSPPLENSAMGATVEESAAAPLVVKPTSAEIELMAATADSIEDGLVACDVLPADTFLNLWQNNPEIQTALGCPIDPHPDNIPAAYPVKTSIQPFEGGTMIWSDHVAWYPQPVIWVIQTDGSFTRFDDSFDIENDAVTGDEVPPDGLFAPMLGFGKVWRTESGVRDAFGWATAPEQPGDGSFQMFEGGNILRLNQENRTYVFLHAENRVEIFDNPDLNN